MRKLRERRVWNEGAGFTLGEVMITIVIMGILAGIAIPSWWSIADSRRVDSATNQLAADLRLAHARSTNRLESWKIVLTSGSSTYQIGKTGSLSDRSLCSSNVCNSRDPKINFTGASPATITFSADGSASVSAGSPTVYTVKIDGRSYSHNVDINTATSRVKVVF